MDNKIDPRWLFAQECNFIGAFATASSALKVEQLRCLPKIVWLGRSNVGKSSLINAVFNRKKLAYTSKTPGRTQEIVIFELAERAAIIDLPGYGYAKVSKQQQQRWQQQLAKFLVALDERTLALVLIDARHELKESDKQMITWLVANNINYRAIFTKTDKSSKAKIDELKLQLPANLNGTLPIGVSSLKKTNIFELQSYLTDIISNNSKSS